MTDKEMKKIIIAEKLKYINSACNNICRIFTECSVLVKDSIQMKLTKNYIRDIKREARRLAEQALNNQS